jgi:hypothetical protein
MKRAARCALALTVLTGAAEVFDERDKVWRLVTDESMRPPNGQHPPDDFNVTAATIFIGVSSYQDHRCGWTLYNAFTKATNPERITIGVVQQNAEIDSECIDDFCKMWWHMNGMDACPFEANVRILRMHARDARGPIFARHKQQSLIKDSDQFCLQVDAHTDFAYGWDHMLLTDYRNARNKFAVLTTYPNPLQDLSRFADSNGQGGEVPHLCRVDFNSGGMPRNWPARRIRKMKAPKLTNLWAAGLSFSL